MQNSRTRNIPRFPTPGGITDPILALISSILKWGRLNINAKAYGRLVSHRGRFAPQKRPLGVAMQVLDAAESMKEGKSSWVGFFQWLRGRSLDSVKLMVGDKCLFDTGGVGEVFSKAKY